MCVKGAIHVRVDDGASCRLIHQTLATRARREPRLTARMRGEEVQGDVEWKTACLRWCVQTEGRTNYQTVAGGGQRVARYSVTVTLPQQFSSVAIEAGLNVTGRVWIDDVKK